MGLVDSRRRTGMWSEPHKGPGEMKWWKGRVWLLAKIRSGLPRFAFWKKVGKSGPRKRRFFSCTMSLRVRPCGLVRVWLKSGCSALKSARMYVGLLWLKGLWSRCRGCVLGLMYAVAKMTVEIMVARKCLWCHVVRNCGCNVVFVKIATSFVGSCSRSIL